MALEKLSPFIFQDSERDFNQYCQMSRMHGPQIIKETLSTILHQSMAWPTVFGIEDTLPQFWQGVPPHVGQSFATTTTISFLHMDVFLNRMHIIANVSFLSQYD